MPNRITTPQFLARKRKGQPIVMVTAYDAPQGRLADAAGVDAILVGDSVGMTTLGYDTTLPVTLEDLLYHTRAVLRGQSARRADACPDGVPTNAERARGARHALIIADMAFGTYGASVTNGVKAGMRLIAEGGAQAVKLEGAGPVVLETIRRLVDIGVPVMGHLGMTPQSIHRFGGFKVQGKTEDAAQTLTDGAVALEQAGAFGIVLEVIPSDLARRVTGSITIPTIGIGAGLECDGQVQVLHDLVGFTDGPAFKHARRYAELGAALLEAIAAYSLDVRERRFPGPENFF
ncbi:MAG: 3-methyl-2-oxobutanoate hydroxymethyltransferase [Cytophagales bacterium]|nr:3-methyl-2-oxobutanoate hydroxymethyltransferase [Armatimonadota bacterium]